MQLHLTAEQVLLADSVRTVLDAEYDATARQASVDHPEGCRPALWRRFAELGWLLLPLAESAGGMGGGMVELGLLMEGFGRRLVVEPYLASAVVGARLLAPLCGTSVGGPSVGEWVADMRQGRARTALAHAELGQADPFAAPRCRATACVDGGGTGQTWRLQGFKPLVVGAPGAQRLLVSARDAQERIGVFVVQADAPGLHAHACSLSDGRRAADLRLEDVPAQRLGAADADALPLLQRVLAQATVAACWAAHGTMREALSRTIEHTTHRIQFGQPLAQFQVVQHRLAEMQVACEEALAACRLASLRIDRQPEALDVAFDAAALARSKVGRAAHFVAQEAVQLHGAMGICEELPIAAMFRTLTAFGQQSGSVGFASTLLGRRQLASGRWRRSATLEPMRALP